MPQLEAQRLGVQIAFALVYTAIALIVLLVAVWIGLNFANYLVAPIRQLIDAAQIVSTGNLFVQVPIRAGEGDLAQLGETFNKMTRELRTQHDDIVRARDLIDSRRRFTEAVLAGASAGVIGVDGENRISILNRSAEAAHRPFPGRSARAAARRGRPRAHRSGRRRARRQAGAGDHQPQRPRAQSVGAGHRGAVRRGRPGLRHHARRHHRPGGRATHLGLGRRRPPHRPRDQEPAHPDPAVGGTAAPQVWPRHQGGRGHLPAVHRHDRPPGRRHKAHGGRILALCPDAQAGDGGGRRGRYGAPGGVPAAGRPSRCRYRGGASPRTRCRRASIAA